MPLGRNSSLVWLGTANLDDIVGEFGSDSLKKRAMPAFLGFTVRFVVLIPVIPGLANRVVGDLAFFGGPEDAMDFFNGTH